MYENPGEATSPLLPTPMDAARRVVSLGHWEKYRHKSIFVKRKVQNKTMVSGSLKLTFNLLTV